MPAARASLPSAFGLVLLLALVPVLAPGNITLLNLGFLTFLFVAQGVAWNILGGFAGYVSFGYAAFYGLGAYTTALLWLAGWPPLLTYPAAGLAAAAFSLIVGVPTLRLTGPYFSIATIGVGEAMRILMLNLDRITGGASGLNLPTAVPSKAWFYLMALLIAAEKGARYEQAVAQRPQLREQPLAVAERHVRHAEQTPAPLRLLLHDFEQNAA